MAACGGDDSRALRALLPADILERKLRFGIARLELCLERRRHARGRLLFFSLFSFDVEVLNHFAQSLCAIHRDAGHKRRFFFIFFRDKDRALTFFLGVGHER